MGDRLEKTVHEESISNGLTYDEAFTTSIKQRGEEVELLFYRILQQVVLHERDRSLNMGLEISEDIGVSYRYYIFQNSYGHSLDDTT